MALPYDICIRGAGVVGQTLALLLAQARLRVALVSGTAPASCATDVRAYALNESSQQLLGSLRAWPDAGSATEVLAMDVESDDGASVHFSASAQNRPALAWIVDVPALQARLSEAVRFQPLIERVAAPVTADLSVICEGRSSSTRAELGVEFDLTSYHQQAIATRVRTTLAHAQVARQWFGQGDILAFLPLDGAHGNSVAVVWSVPEDQVDALLALEPAQFCQRLEAASSGALGRIELIGERMAWPLQQALARRWSGRAPWGAWVLAGDAAHAVHPLAGQGLNLGLADAKALASILEGRDYWRNAGDQRLLRRYERERKAAVLPACLVMDGLQQLFTQPPALVLAARSLGMKGFDRSGPIKNWVAQQAMGLAQL